MTSDRPHPARTPLRIEVLWFVGTVLWTAASVGALLWFLVARLDV